jgi:glycerol-3-phosphate cytidylyltransferase-like family protein
VRSQGRRVCLIAGTFDVLVAGHALALSEEASPSNALFVAVTKATGEALSIQARAELVASLRTVECVIPVGGELAGLIDVLQPDEVLDWERDDRERFQGLLKHVQQRHAE